MRIDTIKLNNYSYEIYSDKLLTYVLLGCY
ncbi:hypothetical protein ABIC84_005278 [Mucilaginibacter sp. 3215]